MAKVPVTELPIFTYTPDQPGRKHLAFIGALPMVFKGKTRMHAHMAADTWRKEEAARLQRAEEAKAKRIEAARLARQKKAAEA